MKILVVSDTHGDFNSFNKAIKVNKDIDIIFHLGDGEKDVEKILEIYPNKNIIYVRGNCDNNPQTPTTYEYTIGNKKIFAAHGHLFNVKSNLLNITNHAISKNANILLFGHTHIPLNTVYNNIYIVNPGSLKKPLSTYAIITIDDIDISVKIMKI